MGICLVWTCILSDPLKLRLVILLPKTNKTFYFDRSMQLEAVVDPLCHNSWKMKHCRHSTSFLHEMFLSIATGRNPQSQLVRLSVWLPETMSSALEWSNESKNSDHFCAKVGNPWKELGRGQMSLLLMYLVWKPMVKSHLSYITERKITK